MLLILRHRFGILADKEAARDKPVLSGAGSVVSPPPQILAALPYDWSGGRLLLFSCLRVVFIPLFVMCVYPADAPTLPHPAWPCFFSLLMGVTNGYFGSVPMIQAAGKLPPEQRELAGEAPPERKRTFLHLRRCLTALATSPLCSPRVSREHHDGFLHGGPDGGLHGGVRGLQLHHAGTQDPHAGHARACQRYGILTASVTKITRTYT